VVDAGPHHGARGICGPLDPGAGDGAERHHEQAVLLTNGRRLDRAAGQGESRLGPSIHAGDLRPDETVRDDRCGRSVGSAQFRLRGDRCTPDAPAALDARTAGLVYEGSAPAVVRGWGGRLRSQAACASSARSFAYVRTADACACRAWAPSGAGGRCRAWFAWRPPEDGSGPLDMNPMVTIGIPTFNRPHLLARALRSVARQDYPNLEVLVADNATPGDETPRVVDSFMASIPNLKYIKHARDIGSFHNFMFLLRAAEGEYFMWLADDDEVSPNYVSSLVVLLGRVLIAQEESVQFINHDYTRKDYASERRRLSAVLLHVCRRLNVHYLYWEACARLLHPAWMPVIVLTSVMSLLREGGAVAI